MVSESMGDAFIDATMPSLFTSIYVLLNALYKISLFAILCPSGTVVGILLYYTLVYRPAKRSHEERKVLLEMRKRNGDFGRDEKASQQKTYMELNRRPRRVAYDVRDFIRRLISSLSDGIVTLITNVSDKEQKKRVASGSASSNRWCAMNKPALHQGTIHQGTMQSNFVRNGISGVRLVGGFDANNRHYPVRKRRIAQNPPEIAKMVKASHMWWTVLDGQSESTSDFLGHQFSTTVQYQGRSFRSDNAAARESNRVLKATIFFDTGEALLRIWSNLLITAVHEKGVDNDWKVELFKVPASVLLEELRNIFDTFYPDGIPMSGLEKEEACELFTTWIQGQDSSQSSDGMCLDSQMVLFKEFHGWFYDLSEMIHQSISDRLLTHVLILSQRSNAASAEAAKILNVVAPKHSNTIYRTYISARPSSVVALSVNSMYTENPFFGNPLISPHSHNPSGHDSIQDIVRHNDGNDHCSIYAQSPFEDRLPDFINPMNNLGGSPRNFTHPDKIHDATKSDDLYCTYPGGVSVENASPSAQPHSDLKGSLHNIRELRDPLRRTPLKSIHPHTPQ